MGDRQWGLYLGLTVLWAVGCGRCDQNCDKGCSPTWESPQPSVKRLYKMAGETANFRCRAFAVPHPRVSWIKDAKHLSPYDQSDARIEMTSDGTGLSITDLGVRDTGVYLCVVENRFGTLQWSVDLRVYDEDEQWVLKAQGRPSNLTTSVGQTAEFRCAVTTNDDGATITWAKEETEGGQRRVLKTTSFRGSDTLTLSELTLNDTGAYWCVINISSQITSFKGWLTVSPYTEPRLAGVQEGGTSTSTFLTYLQGLGISVGAVLGLLLLGALLVSAITQCRARRLPPPPAARLTHVRPVPL